MSVSVYSFVFYIFLIADKKGEKRIDFDISMFMNQNPNISNVYANIYFEENSVSCFSGKVMKYQKLLKFSDQNLRLPVSAEMVYNISLKN